MSIWRDLSQELFGCHLAIWIMPTGECFVISYHFCMHVNLIKFLTTEFWYFSARSDFAVSGRPHSFALPSVYRSLLDPFYRRGQIKKRKFCLFVCLFVSHHFFLSLSIKYFDGLYHENHTFSESIWHLPPVLPCSDRPPPRIDHTGRRSIKIPNRLWYGKWAGLMSTLRTYICWNISSGSFLRKIIFFHLPNGSQKCILKWSYCPEMLAPFLKLILKSTSFSISYHLDQPLPSSRPPYNVENRVSINQSYVYSINHIWFFQGIKALSSHTIKYTYE